MRYTGMLAGVGLVAAMVISPVWGGEAPSPGNREEKPHVTVTSAIPIRPELQVFQGVRGWKVNGQEISLAQVQDRAVTNYGPYVLQDLVTETLLEQQAKQAKVTATEAEVDEAVKQLRAENGFTPEALESFLRQSRLTMGWLRQTARNRVLMDKVLGGQVYVSDKEVADFYQQYRDQYRRPASVQFRVITLRNEAQAKAAAAEIRGGKSFQEVAKAYAPTPEEKALAGELHTYAEGSRMGIPPELETVLFTVPLNQLAGPIKTSFQGGNYFHLLRVEKKTDAYQFTLEEVRDTIRTQMRKQKLEQRVWPDWIRAQLGGASIETLKTP